MQIRLVSMESYLHKAVDCHDGHVRLALGVVHEVQVDQLLQLQVISLHAVHYIREQGAGGGEKEGHRVGPSTSVTS